MSQIHVGLLDSAKVRRSPSFQIFPSRISSPAGSIPGLAGCLKILEFPASCPFSAVSKGEHTAKRKRRNEIKKTPHVEQSKKGSHQLTQFHNKITRTMKKKVTTSLALKAIYKKFSDCCKILNVNEGAILDILTLDLHSGKYYEVWSNAGWDKLYIEQVTFINETK